MTTAVIKATPWGGAVNTMNSLLAGLPTKGAAVAVPIVIWGQTLVSDIQPLIALGVMFGLDLITGLARAFKRREFNSPALYRTGGKLFVYCILAIVATQATLAVDYLFFMPSVVYGYIALTELASIIENLNDLGYRVPILNTVYRFLALRKIDDRKKSGTLSKMLVNELFTEGEIDSAISDLENRKGVLHSHGAKTLRETTRLDESRMHMQRGPEDETEEGQ